MAYKMGLMLSMVFVFLLFAFGGDLISVQLLYSEMDTVSMNVGYMISKYANLSKVDEYVRQQGMVFTFFGDENLHIGECYEYSISCVYNPLVLDDETMNVSIKRTAIVGYYK